MKRIGWSYLATATFVVICGIPHSRCRVEKHNSPPGLLADSMPSSTLEGVGIPQYRIIKWPIKVLGFDCNASFILGIINLDLTIGGPCDS